MAHLLQQQQAVQIEQEGPANAPAVHLSYTDAEAFCTWAGCRMPTEEERLLAAMITAKQAKSDDEQFRVCKRA
jgi:formylglycine-generating enzyme required for sulfatase activity